MSLHPRVLLVGTANGVTPTLARSLKSAGFEPNVVGDFPTAKELLSTCPELLITELKLGAFNGLHLAIRAGAQGTPTIIIGEPDPVLEAEAQRQHAQYFPSVADHEEIIAAVRELLAAAMRKRRSPRKQVPLLAAFVNEIPVHLLDVSYEGLRLKTADTDSKTLSPQFTVRLPLFNFSCAVQRVWTAPIDGASDASGISCGAELSIENADAVLAWRALVDAMPGLALSA